MRGSIKATATLGLTLTVCEEMITEFKAKGGTLLPKLLSASQETERILKGLERVSPKEGARIEAIIDHMNTKGLSDQPSWQVYLSMGIACISDRAVEIRHSKPDSSVAKRLDALVTKYQRLHTHFACRTRHPQWDVEGTRLYVEWEELFN